MSEEKIYVVREHYHTPTIPESDSISVIQESDSVSLITDTNSAYVAHESDTPVVLEGTVTKKGHVRRFSTGNIGIPYKSVNILSRYLAASAGSCHDYCKYGQRQYLETKTTSNFILETIMEGQGKGQDTGKFLNSAERKKKLAVNYVASRGSRTQKRDITVNSKKEVPSSTKTEVLLKQLSLPIEEVDPRPSPMLPKSRSLPIKNHLSLTRSGEMLENKEMRTSLGNSHGASRGVEQMKLRRTNETKKSILNGKKVLAKATSLSALHSVKKVLARPIASLSPKHSEKRVSSVSNENFKSLKGASQLKDCSDVRKGDSKNPNNKSVPVKTWHVTGLKARNKAVKLTQDSGYSSSPSSIHKDNNSKHQKGISPVRLSLSSAGKILKRTHFGIHASRSPKSSESKSLRLAKQEICVPGSSISSLASSRSNQVSTSSEDIETDMDSKLVNTKVKPRTRAINGGTINTKLTDSPARKLTFRKGKVLELHPVIDSPRRLKFRRTNLIDVQISKVDTTESTIKNKEVHVDEVANDTKVKKSESMKVVLKHQDADEKKAEQNLLNDVIEETASKLAESRRSKVKALVGAFETVISRQDTRPILSTIDAR